MVYLYRALRYEETATSLRVPPASLKHADKDDLRNMVLTNIAHGNKVTSPFLHCSTDFQTCRRLSVERRRLYSGTIVRFNSKQLDDNCILRLDSLQEQRKCKLLFERPEDTEADLANLRKARRFSFTDKEVLVMCSPTEVQFVDNTTGFPLEPALDMSCNLVGEDGWYAFECPVSAREWHWNAVSQEWFWNDDVLSAAGLVFAPLFHSDWFVLFLCIDTCIS